MEVVIQCAPHHAQIIVCLHSLLQSKVIVKSNTAKMTFQRVTFRHTHAPYSSSHNSCFDRELQRMEIISKSPVLALLGEMLAGLSTVRAYGHQERFLAMFRWRVDINTLASLWLNTANRWLGIRLVRNRCTGNSRI